MHGQQKSYVFLKEAAGTQFLTWQRKSKMRNCWEFYRVLISWLLSIIVLAGVVICKTSRNGAAMMASWENTDCIGRCTQNSISILSILDNKVLQKQNLFTLKVLCGAYVEKLMENDFKNPDFLGENPIDNVQT